MNQFALFALCFLINLATHAMEHTQSNVQVPITVADRSSTFDFPKEFLESSSMLRNYLGLSDDALYQTSDDGSALDFTQEIPHFSYDDLTTLVKIWRKPSKIKNLNNKKQLERFIIATNFIGFQNENLNLLALLAKKHLLVEQQYELFLMDKERDTLPEDSQIDSYYHEEDPTVIDKLNQALASVQVSCAELLCTKKKSQLKDNEKNLEEYYRNGLLQLLTKKYTSSHGKKIRSLDLSNQLVTNLDGLKQFFFQVQQAFPEQALSKCVEQYRTPEEKKRIEKKRQPWTSYAKISEVNLSHNSLNSLNCTQLPKSYRMLSSWDFSYNKVSNVVLFTSSHCKTCQFVRYLDLSHNNLSGTFDLLKWLICFPYIRKIDVSHNQFDTVILADPICKKVTINLSNNVIKKVVSPQDFSPEEFTLDLRNNQLTQEQIQQLKVNFYLSPSQITHCKCSAALRYVCTAIPFIMFPPIAIYESKLSKQCDSDDPLIFLKYLEFIILGEYIPYTFRKTINSCRQRFNIPTDTKHILSGGAHMLFSLFSIPIQDRLINYVVVPPQLSVHLNSKLTNILAFGTCAAGLLFIKNRYEKRLHDLLAKKVTKYQSHSKNHLFTD